jgi:glycosyltransferase involved in cell wall biosynthesis
MKTGLIITAYNRPHYLKRCLDSIRVANLSSIDTIMIVDDHSTDDETIRLINEFNISNNRVELIKAFSKEKRTVKGSLLFGLDILFKTCDVVMNLDGDAIVNKDFAERLLEMKRNMPDRIITGFNCLTKNLDGTERHKILSVGKGFNLKKSVGGLNMVFDKQQYMKWIQPTLIKSLQNNLNWDDHTCRA